MEEFYGFEPSVVIKRALRVFKTGKVLFLIDNTIRITYRHITFL